MNDAQRADLIAAIRVFTVERPHDDPALDEADVAYGLLDDALDTGRSWPKMPRAAKDRIDQANAAAFRYEAALDRNVKALRAAAEAAFGGDFRRPAPLVTPPGDHAPVRRTVQDLAVDVTGADIGLSPDLRVEEQRAAAIVGGGAAGAAEAVLVARDSMKLQSVVRRYQRAVERGPTFMSMRQEADGDIALPFRDSTGTAQMVFGAMGHLLEGMKASNYVQIGGYHPAMGRLECIVQRVGRLSPHDARTIAEQHLGRAVALLQAHGIAWDGPTTFPPDEPVPRPVPLGDHPWLALDVSVQPNVLRCSRCGTGQPMPAEGTADVLQAMIEAFGKQHEGCEEVST